MHIIQDMPACWPALRSFPVVLLFLYPYSTVSDDGQWVEVSGALDSLNDEVQSLETEEDDQLQQELKQDAWDTCCEAGMNVPVDLKDKNTNSPEKTEMNVPDDLNLQNGMQSGAIIAKLAKVEEKIRQAMVGLNVASSSKA